MALHPTVSEFNLRNSLKKYFIDAIQTGEGVPVTFDKGLVAPTIQGLSATEWVSCIVGPLVRDTVSELVFDIFCCTTEDEEGYRLSQITDIVMSYLLDEDGYLISIPLYNTNITPWVQVGALLPLRALEQNPTSPIANQTKVRHIAITIKYPAKI